MFTPAVRAKCLPAPEPLRGVPPVRRLKTYRADTGFSWSYYYEGHRLEVAPHPGQAYLFTLQPGTRTQRQVTIAIPERTLAEARERMGSAIASRESYALAKMYLFSMLDREEQPAPDSRWELQVDALISIWEQLDL